MTDTRGLPASPERARPGKGEGGGGPIARIALFIRQVIDQLRKVTWPTRQQLVTYFWVVLVFVLVVIAIVVVFDLVLGWALFQLLA